MGWKSFWICYFFPEPNPPESLSASALRSDEIRVLLSPPQGEFDGYELSFSPSTGGPILLEPDTREHLLYNLQSNTAYNIQVFAYSGSNGQRLEGDAISTTATTGENEIQTCVWNLTLWNSSITRKHRYLYVYHQDTSSYSLINVHVHVLGIWKQDV